VGYGSAAIRYGRAQGDVRHRPLAGIARDPFRRRKAYRFHALGFIMDYRAFAVPKGLRPRRRVKPGNDDVCGPA